MKTLKKINYFFTYLRDIYIKQNKNLLNFLVSNFILEFIQINFQLTKQFIIYKIDW